MIKIPPAQKQTGGGGGTPPTPRPTTLAIYPYDRDAFAVGTGMPISVDFGILNNSSVDVTNMNMSITEDPSFRMGENECTSNLTIIPNEGCLFNIEMNSDTPSTKPLTITAKADGIEISKTYQITFKDGVILEIAEDTYKTTHYANRVSTVDYVLNNRGNRATTLDINVNSPDSTYVLQTGGCTALQPSSSCFISIEFKPRFAGTHHATLTIKNPLAGINELRDINTVAVDAPKLKLFGYVWITKGASKTDKIKPAGIANIGSQIIKGGVRAVALTKGFTVTPNAACSEDINFKNDVNCELNIFYDTNAQTAYGVHNGVVEIAYAGIVEHVEILAVVTPGMGLTSINFASEVEQGKTVTNTYELTYTGSGATPDTATLSFAVDNGFTISDTSTCGNTIAKGAKCNILVDYTATGDNAKLGSRNGTLYVTLDGYQIPNVIYINVIPPLP